MHHAYPGITVVEDNAAGEAVRENLNLPEHQVLGFTTRLGSGAKPVRRRRRLCDAVGGGIGSAGSTA
jgi:hypothetical protein